MRLRGKDKLKLPGRPMDWPSDPTKVLARYCTSNAPFLSSARLAGRSQCVDATLRSNSHVGTFTEALLTQANRSGWIAISMKDDRKRIYPFDK